MDLIDTIDMTFSDLATTVDQGAERLAEHTPAPLDSLVLRVGAINAEAMRQTGRVYVTNLDAVRGVARVAWTGASELADATVDAAEDSAATIRTTSRRAAGDVKQASSTIRNRAGKAAADVGRNFRVVGDKAERAGKRVGRKAGDAADDMVKAADAATAETSSRGAKTPTGSYENWSKDELYERAQELDIDGRSQMSKPQLIRALRSA